MNSARYLLALNGLRVSEATGADVGDRREQGVLPEVVGLPPGDLIE
ncbi:MAG TPA: hypothetical protein VIY52_31920 [Streptosporangiaceae bacterium]